MERCIVCRAQARLDDSGRCGSCAAAKEASRIGVNYGAYISANQVQAIQRPSIEDELYMLRNGYKRCIICGHLFNTNRTRMNTCSDACRAVRKTLYRNVVIKDGV